ncbi:uncharacterized protein EMH_0000590 [Eimeria mitis]|uniref:Transmembrane protein n=1 Tax=Eimeria mitis TaxID=44415 RepID=U6JXH5_9EIME|nr:uncharacterized protein EMH_0000590 [Eimeria mitis]CDJ28223.1 hypothetical protein EMH_0000590 [Eimeria mitis]
MFGRPSFPWCMPLFAAATAALGAEARTPETTNAPSSYAAAVSAVMLHDETLRPDLFPPLNVVVGQPLGGLESSVFIEGQKQRQISQLLAVSAGLVAVVCLAVAFFVLQCARKALFPRLFGPLGRRALSDSEWEDKWLEECPEYDSEGQEDEGDEEGTWDEIPAAETGESVALQTLEALRDLMTLGMRTMPHLTFPDRGTLLVLLLTISTQELVLCGVYATPAVEAERQKTVDFIRENGLKELQQLHTTREKCNAKGRAKKMLRLLERFGTSRSVPNLSELAVEASICAYRIAQCYKALEQLQPWVEMDLPIPEKVVEQALAVFSYTRKTAKSRLKLDPAANAWVVDIQGQRL